ncbi:MAG: cytochrome c family protein [Pirellula sp.]|nr:cytochrome c family protein [Pirellula sp.]
MPRTNHRFCFLSTQMCILLVAYCWSLSTDVAGAMEPDANSPHAIRVGVKECAACHTQPGILYPKVGVTRYVRLTEAAQWFAWDKHAHAYELVRQDLKYDEWDNEPRHSNRKTRDILKLLGWLPTGTEFQRQCLTCHAGLELEEDVDSRLVRDNLPFGVQCESCHGKGSLYTRTDLHQQATWRSKSVEEKRSYGMHDLANPVTAARVCLSCHQGDIKQGRFVTHAMYAAGHPPLPPFELQTFLDAMPPHWSPLEAKPYTNEGDNRPDGFEYQREVYLTRMDLDPEASTDVMKQRISSHYARSQRSQIGAQIANDSAVMLILDAANQPNLWGDYAFYDCMGCHQTLSADKPRYRPPGRVPGRAFPSISMDVTEQIFGSASDAWTNAFNKTPFGDPDRLRSISPHIESVIQQREQNAIVQSRRWVDAPTVRAWIIQMFEERRQKLSDYWVARQTAWMVLVAVDELIRKGAMEEHEADPLRDELTLLLRLDLRIDQKQSVLVRQAEILETANTFDSRRAAELLESLIQIANRPLVKPGIAN